jgi:hypothetical protein
MFDNQRRSMFDQNGHLTDEELVGLFDREVSMAAMNDARAHCMECSVCQSRRSQLEQALSKFSDLYSTTINSPMLKSSLNRRAELQQRLTVAGLQTPISWPGRFTHHRRHLLAAAAIFAIAIVIFRTNAFTQNKPHSDQKALRLLPDRTFTPGATRSVNLADVCSQREEDLDPAVSDRVRKVVFQEYGMMSSTKTDGYQVDYLINPQLGGTADVRNLWPEPYGSTVWNAHAKDALEDRLHRMVCDKQIDLASAQHAIATDWIAAYKKYFHAENPT